MAFPCVDNVYTNGFGSCSDSAYIDPYLYVLYWGGWPSYDPKVYKLDPVTYEKIAQWTAPYQAAFGEAITSDCEYLYVGTSNRGATGQHHPLHVYKIDPDTMATITSWQGPGGGDRWASALKFDFKTERLFLLDDVGRYQIYKLRKDLTLEMSIAAESSGPPWQWYGNDLTVLGDYFYVATGGTPGQIVKRRTSDLELVDWFTGYENEPDDYIEGIFFNVCNDGEFLYTATYDYSEYRPLRLIKVKPEDMSRWSTYYGSSDELMAYGSYYYGGRVYITNYGWNGIYWDEPGFAEGEVVLQINPDGMYETDRYMNWGVDWAYGWKGMIGDGSRLHVGMSNPARSVLQFEVGGDTRSTVGIGNKVILSTAEDKRAVEKISVPQVGNRGMLINTPSRRCFLPEPSIRVGNACEIQSAKDRRFARKRTIAHTCGIDP